MLKSLKIMHILNILLSIGGILFEQSKSDEKINLLNAHTMWQ